MISWDLINKCGIDSAASTRKQRQGIVPQRQSGLRAQALKMGRPAKLALALRCRPSLQSLAGEGRQLRLQTASHLRA